MKVVTRVMSVWKAKACKSSISLACSSNVAGMPPMGRSTTGKSREDCSSANWIRRSTSRMASRYSVTLVRSLEPSPFRMPLASWKRESRMLRSLRIRASRTFGSVLLLSPNRFSNTARGWFSIGIGVVGVRLEGGAFRLLGMNARQERCGGTRMISPALARLWMTLRVGEAAQHEKMIPKCGQRLQNRGYLQRAHLRWRPLMVQIHDSVRNIHEGHAGHRFGDHVGSGC